MLGRTKNLIKLECNPFKDFQSQISSAIRCNLIGFLYYLSSLSSCNITTLMSLNIHVPNSCQESHYLTSQILQYHLLWPTCIHSTTAAKMGCLPVTRPQAPIMDRNRGEKKQPNISSYCEYIPLLEDLDIIPHLPFAVYCKGELMLHHPSDTRRHSVCLTTGRYTAGWMPIAELPDKADDGRYYH